MGLLTRLPLWLSAFLFIPPAFSSAHPGTQDLSAAAESAAFQQARAQTAPESRIAAFTAYLDHFPSGSHRNLAQELLLKTYLASSPDRTAPIHTLATALIASTPAGIERWQQQALFADLLAGAEPAGADLPDAQLWAQAALDALTEPAFRHETTVTQLRYKLPKLTLFQIHTQFLTYRASFLATAAHVALDLHQTSLSTQYLTEANRLNPLNPEVNLLQAQLALAANQPQPALTLFERADALGPLTPAIRRQELQLFQTLNPGAAPETLDRQVDTLYRTLYPPLYTLPPRHLPPGGHTTLLELFSSTSCTPCAGPDLAIESLLTTYTREDLAVLEFDQHIPRPDPLTIPASVTRAAFYNAETTPQAFLDGQPLQILGASRHDVENIVISFADTLEAQAALPSGLQLAAIPSRMPTGDLQAAVTLTPISLPHANPGETTGDTSLRTLAHAQLFAALVQDNLRYTGENGIRFHRMVVRSLQHFPAANFLTTADPKARTLTFQIAAIEGANTAYLTGYESDNDRFGAFHFPQKNFPLTQSPLALVVWIQNPATKEVLQTTFVPLPSNAPLLP